MNPVWAALVASVVGLGAGSASVDAPRGDRPSHFLYASVSDATFLDTWSPDGRADATARHVRQRALEVAGTSPAAVTLAVMAGERALHDSTPGGYAEAVPPFFRAQGTHVRPCSGPLVAGFGPRERVGTGTAERHSGQSYRVGPGEQVRAVAAGVVWFAADVRGMGLTVIVAHGDEYHTVYAGLSALSVEPGDAVSAAASIGEGAGSGVRPGEVYFELRDRGIPVDPAPWLRAR